MKGIQKKLDLSQEAVRNLTRTELRDGKADLTLRGCTLGTCPTNCACPPPR
jgi:hypothetical protein